MIGHFKKCCKKLGNFPKDNSNQQNQSSAIGSGRMNIATAVSQLDIEFFDERGLPKVYNLPPTQQIGSMNVLKRIPNNNAILISEEGEEIQPIEQPKQPNNTHTPSVPGSVSGSVPPSDFSQIEFPLMEVVNQSQINSPSISDTIDLSETNNSSRKASRSTDLPLKSMQNRASDKEMKEIRDLTISVKSPQSTRDFSTIPISNNSTLRKSISGTKETSNKCVSFDREGEIHPERQLNNNRSVMPIDVQALTVLQDSLPDPIHFIEKGFKVKNTNSTQRKGEDTAFQLIQKIHNQLQQVQWDLQRLHSMHKYEF